MAGVELAVLALALMVPLFFPVRLIGPIGVPIVAGMTGTAALLFYASFRLLYRREKNDKNGPYVTPERETDILRGEPRLESKADKAKSFYFSDGTGRHFRRGGGRF